MTFGLPAVAEDHIAARRTGGIDEAARLPGRYRRSEGCHSVLRNALGVKGLEPGGTMMVPTFDFLDLFRFA